MPDKIVYEIPIIESDSNAGSYRSVPFDLEDPRFHEPLVKVSDYGIAGESYYARTDGQNAPYFEAIKGATKEVWARKSVVEKLVRVNRHLAPQGCEVFVWDAYRPVACQQGLWDFFWGQALRKMPHASDEERRKYVLTFVSDPTTFAREDWNTWPVHACGGAVDLTVRKLDTKELLDMGAEFDEMDGIAFSDAFERRLKAGEIAEDDLRLNNRRLLHRAMTSEGFVNYHCEFWHFDFGDQMYALHSQMRGLPNAPEKAWYGYSDSPED